MVIKEIYEFAKIKHKGQKRKNGEDYIIHPYRVAESLIASGYGDDYIAAGLLHDVLEDTDTTEEEILKISNKKVLEAVKLLTKRKEVKSRDYIDAILNNPIAKAVKNADRIDNLKDAKKADRNFAKRYAQNTKEYYLNKFSKELDMAYEDLLKVLGE